jgi:hypothetical protein
LLLIAVIYIPSFIIDRKSRKIIFQYTRDNTEGYRQANMSSNDISSSRSLLEIIINGSFNFFDKKLDEAYLKSFDFEIEIYNFTYFMMHE